MEHTEYNYVTVALYCVGEELENLMRTNKQTDKEHTENSKPEATLIPVDRRGERANKWKGLALVVCSWTFQYIHNQWD